jgi:predicted metal-dependent hydrolase
VAFDTRKWIVLGVDQFNRLEFMEAHDSWEHVWLTKPGAEASFAQGLIQLAAAYLHIKRGTSPQGTLRLFNSALRKLEPFEAGFCGVDRGRVIDAASAHRERLVRDGAVRLADGEYPRLAMIDAEGRASREG